MEVATRLRAETYSEYKILKLIAQSKMKGMPQRGAKHRAEKPSVISLKKKPKNFLKNFLKKVLTTKIEVII